MDYESRLSPAVQHISADTDATELGSAAAQPQLKCPQSMSQTPNTFKEQAYDVSQKKAGHSQDCENFNSLH